jgi:hypothetical protein
LLTHGEGEEDVVDQVVVLKHLLAHVCHLVLQHAQHVVFAHQPRPVQLKHLLLHLNQAQQHTNQKLKKKAKRNKYKKVRNVRK